MVKISFRNKGLVMKTVNKIIVISLFLFISCSQSQLKFDIQKEYEELAEIKERKVVVNEIYLLKSRSMDFENLARIEIQIIEEINKLRTKELEEVAEMDSLIRVKIFQQKCLLNNADSEYRKKYLREIESDSIKLKENHEKELKLKIGIMEDEVKILEILELSKLDSIQSSENLSIRHIVDISIDGKRIVDTLRYVRFNNRSYNYLNKNLFLEN